MVWKALEESADVAHCCQAKAKAWKERMLEQGFLMKPTTMLMQVVVEQVERQPAELERVPELG